MKGMTILLVSMATAARAETLTVNCASEDSFIQGWTSPLTVTYSGDDHGTITVKSEHVVFELPARRTQLTVPSNGKDVPEMQYYAADDVDSAMPEPAELISCIAAAKTDEILDLTNCAPNVRVQLAKVHATAEILLIDDPGLKDNSPIVSVSRRYLGAKLPSGADMKLETFPKDCRLTKG